MDEGSFLTLAAPAEVETRVRGSVFRALAAPVADEEEARAALAAATRRVGVPAVRVRIRYPYEHTAAVMRVLEPAQAREAEHGYTTGGLGEVELTVPRNRLGTVQQLLRAETAGALVPEVIGERLLFRAAASQ